ncbi:class I SAM-dependent methyltransferase [Amycolatopsis aidingensis]|uniref:class I SAM-dependent methyltransferase n=1 Tax=Amycolatopsis aidingensis TaxID=2842453 RepID=UPI001C0D3092|nr:class I SAM-dependent methyltransferase [Amycolatopsis aidingensis]
MTRSFEQLLAEGMAEPVTGWDFSWLAGRATEERPSWGYARMLTERLGSAAAALDLQTGGGEVFAEVLGSLPRPPATVAATESWPPNIELARANLRPFGGSVALVAEDAALPFEGGTFDLVASRHPTVTDWTEIARVLRPGGRYLSQGIGSGSNRELTEAIMGPVPVDDPTWARQAVAGAEAAGLIVLDLRTESLRAEFHDIGAVVYFLRKVPWTVPGFSVERDRERLAELHERIRAEGQFVAHAERFLIEARKPDPS